MVFSAALHTTMSTGGSPRPEGSEVKQREYPTVDLQARPHVPVAHDKEDVLAYTYANAKLVSIAGLVTGLQEAFYTYEKMPDVVTRRLFHQGAILTRIIGRKTLLGAAMGAAFAYTEASLENLRGKHDMVNGMAGGAAAGLLFSMLPYKAMPQPLVWPVVFALAPALADIISEKIPAGMQGFRHYGPVRGRENWNDPEPPRPPIYDTGSSSRPSGGNWWRGA